MHSQTTNPDAVRWRRRGYRNGYRDARDGLQLRPVFPDYPEYVTAYNLGRSAFANGETEPDTEESHVV